MSNRPRPTHINANGKICSYVYSNVSFVFNRTTSSLIYIHERSPNRCVLQFSSKKTVHHSQPGRSPQLGHNSLGKHVLPHHLNREYCVRLVFTNTDDGECASILLVLVMGSVQLYQHLIHNWRKHSYKIEYILIVSDMECDFYHHPTRSMLWEKPRRSCRTVSLSPWRNSLMRTT